MNDSQASSRTTMWLPVMAGITGAAIALLFAPRSGKETRQQLKTAAIGAKGKATEGLDTAKASVEELQKQAREAKSRVAEVIKTKRRKSADSGDMTDMESNSRRTDERTRGSWEEEV